MKPTIEFDKEKSVIKAILKPNMTKHEIYEFIDDLHATLNQTDNKSVSLFTNAEEKDFDDLETALELSESFRKLLEESHVERFAFYRPQADYYSDNEVDFKGQFKTFTNLNEANSWLEN